MKGISALWTACALIAAESPLDRAYAELRAKNYDAAIALFREGLRIEPARTGPRKDLAYTLLKTGETEQARDEFARLRHWHGIGIIVIRATGGADGLRWIAHGVRRVKNEGEL